MSDRELFYNYLNNLSENSEVYKKFNNYIYLVNDMKRYENIIELLTKKINEEYQKDYDDEYDTNNSILRLTELKRLYLSKRKTTEEELKEIENQAIVKSIIIELKNSRERKIVDDTQINKCPKKRVIEKEIVFTNRVITRFVCYSIASVVGIIFIVFLICSLKTFEIELLGAFLGPFSFAYIISERICDKLPKEHYKNVSYDYAKKQKSIKIKFTINKIIVVCCLFVVFAVSAIIICLVPPDDKHSIKVLSYSESVNKGEYAYVSIKGENLTDYHAMVYYNSGASTASGLGWKTSDSNGYVKWTWMVGTRTADGVYNIYISDEDNELETLKFSVN